MRLGRAVDVRRLRADETALFRPLRRRAVAVEGRRLTTVWEADLVARVTALTRGWSI